MTGTDSLWSRLWALSVILGEKALVFENNSVLTQFLQLSVQQLAPVALWASKLSTASLKPLRQLMYFMFHMCLNSLLNWHLNNMKSLETPWTPTSLYRCIWLHLNPRIFLFTLILQKTSLVSIPIYSTRILGLFFVLLHLIIFSRVQTFYDMQILTRTWLLFIQTFSINKPITATCNVEEFYSYCNSVPSSTANITIIFQMS